MGELNEINTTGSDRMRDKQFIYRKAEHFSTPNDLLCAEYCITKRVMANSIRIY